MAEQKMYNAALVLQGGGTRGAYTAGVIDVLMEEGIDFPYLIGTSAGALNGVDFLSKDIGRSKFVSTELVCEPKMLSFRNFRKTGNVFNLNYLLYEIPKKRYPLNEEQFNNSKTRFIVACTSMKDGQAIYFEKGKTDYFLPAVAASSSLPLVSEIQMVGDEPCLDGGQVAAIPWRKALEDGNEKLVVVMTRPIDYRKKHKMKAFQRAWAKNRYKKYPEFLKTYFGYNALYNRDMDDLEALHKEGKVFLIAPPVSLGISNMERNHDTLLKIYENAKKQTHEILLDLLKFLGRPNE